MSSAPADRSGSASGIVATARLTGQTSGAALAALCFGLAGREGAHGRTGAWRGIRRGRMRDKQPASDRKDAIANGARIRAIRWLMSASP